MVSRNFLFPNVYVGHDSSSYVKKKLEEESPVCVKQIYLAITIRTYLYTSIAKGNFQCYFYMKPEETIDNGNKSNGRRCQFLYCFPDRVITFLMWNFMTSI